MPSLKDYRDKIESVKSTRKITSAMKMVAASKLKKAQEQAEKSQPYAERMAGMLSRLVENTQINDASPKLLAGTGHDDKHLLIIVTSDRGLCGGFNSNIAKLARQQISTLQAQGKSVQMICIGRKGNDLLKSNFANDIVALLEGPGKKGLSYVDADEAVQLVLDMLDREEFDICTILYNKFKNVITQIPTTQQVIPFALPEVDKDAEVIEETGIKGIYEFEPSEEEILASLLPRNLGTQIFRAMLDSAAGEQAARMTAMDNATRNAGEKIDELTLTYNRVRQAHITTELVEIIAGAEAVK